MRAVLAGVASLVLVLFAAGCRDSGPIKDAQIITVENVFTFQVPGDMSGIDSQGIDSIVGRFASPVMELDYDYSAHADALGNESKPEFKLTLLTIDGHEATIERYTDAEGSTALPLVAAIHFPDAGGGIGLTMYTRCADEDAQDLAVDIFRTIRFVDAQS